MACLFWAALFAFGMMGCFLRGPAGEPGASSAPERVTQATALTEGTAALSTTALPSPSTPAATATPFISQRTNQSMKAYTQEDADSVLKGPISVAQVEEKLGPAKRMTGDLDGEEGHAYITIVYDELEIVLGSPDGDKFSFEGNSEAGEPVRAGDKRVPMNIVSMYWAGSKGCEKLPPPRGIVIGDTREATLERYLNVNLRYDDKGTLYGLEDMMDIPRIRNGWSAMLGGSIVTLERARIGKAYFALPDRFCRPATYDQIAYYRYPLDPIRPYYSGAYTGLAYFMYKGRVTGIAVYRVEATLPDFLVDPYVDMEEEFEENPEGGEEAAGEDGGNVEDDAAYYDEVEGTPTPRPKA